MCSRPNREFHPRAGCCSSPEVGKVDFLGWGVGYREKQYRSVHIPFSITPPGRGELSTLSTGFPIPMSRLSVLRG
jgi:hypothetical protein